MQLALQSEESSEGISPQRTQDGVLVEEMVEEEGVGLVVGLSPCSLMGGEVLGGVESGSHFEDRP